MDLGLTDKIAMVGGASKGLGYAVAHALAAEGARLSIASRDSDGIRRAAETIGRETGAQVLPNAVDLSRDPAIASWHAATVKALGGVDLLYANTGGPPAGTALGFDDAAWQSAFELLLLSVIRSVRLVVPTMRARGGGAILVGTSSTVKEPVPNLALSNVMRAGVTALVKTLSLELAAEAIRINTLLPGRIATDRLHYLDGVNAERAGITVEAQRTRAAGAIPFARYGEPAEFGRAAAFLLSGAASYITGAALQVDGGLLRGLL
jgi:3-oxoacyl-[acyl-carrier protein] reductase